MAEENVKISSELTAETPVVQEIVSESNNTTDQPQKVDAETTSSTEVSVSTEPEQESIADSADSNAQANGPSTEADQPTTPIVSQTEDVICDRESCESASGTTSSCCKRKSESQTVGEEGDVPVPTKKTCCLV